MNESLKAIVTDVLKEQTADLLEGAAEDVHLYVSEIAHAAARIGYEAPEKQEILAEELQQQITLLAEVHRIRASRKAWETFDRVVDVLVGISISAVTKGLA